LIVFFIRKTDPIIVLSTKEEIDEFVGTWSTTVIGFFEEPTKLSPAKTSGKQMKSQKRLNRD
jgi:hypothetical protein